MLITWKQQARLTYPVLCEALQWNTDVRGGACRWPGTFHAYLLERSFGNHAIFGKVSLTSIIASLILIHMPLLGIDVIWCMVSGEQGVWACKSSSWSCRGKCETIHLVLTPEWFEKKGRMLPKSARPAPRLHLVWSEHIPYKHEFVQVA